MRSHFIALAMLLCLSGRLVSARRSELYSSKYYVFQSSLSLNTHLFLYGKALRCKFEKTSNDSLAYYALKDKWDNFSKSDRAVLNATLRFYKDSLLSHDLLFDSLMRNFEDYLGAETSFRARLRAWQISAFEAIRLFQPYFTKCYWPAIDSANKAWLGAHKAEVAAMEKSVVPELEKVFRTKLPESKIRVDLCCYATWAGAYSYRESGCHIMLSTREAANQGILAAEVMFHETCHFLADKLTGQIAAVAKEKDLKETALWHDLIFYTTAFVMEKEYRLKWQKYEAYYVKMKFQENLPGFKTSVEACRLFWDPYLRGETNFDKAVSDLVTYIAGK